MDKLSYIAAAAMTSQNILRQTATNNLANVSTTGFKNSFDTAQGALKAYGPGFDSRFIPQIFSEDVVDLSPGARMMTGRSLDIAMDGQTVMGVQAANGDLAFTRRGDLRVTQAGILETGAGHAVQGAAGPITVPLGFEVTISQDGTLFTLDPQAPDAEPVEVGQLLLRDASETQLGRRRDGLYSPMRGEEIDEGRDIPVTAIAPSVSSGQLEGSNISAVSTMVDLLEMSRNYELQVKLISQVKSLDQSGSSMMRLS